MSLLFTLGSLPLGLALLASIQANSEATWNRGKEYVYKQTPQGPLKAHLYFPPQWRIGDRRPAIAFFFGGAFRRGSPRQFQYQAEYFASRGMVAASAEYRIRDVHSTDPDSSAEDCRDAIAWLRSKAPELGVDPQAIVASGGSAGATCAAAAGLISAPSSKRESPPASPVPNALILFNPVMDMVAQVNMFKTGSPDQRASRARGLSMVHHIEAGQPPALVFFGDADPLAAPATSWMQRMRSAGNRAELFLAEGQNHGFYLHQSFRANAAASGWYEACLYQADLFLISLGYLDGKPAIDPGPRKLRPAR